jgi:cytochrome P450
MWCTFSGVPLPPPFREAQHITLALDAAVNGLLDDRIAHPTDSADLLNVLFHADNGTWPRRRIRDEALTFMLAGHETTANAMSWFWCLMALNRDARDRMLAEVDDVLAGRTPTAADLTRLPWTHRLRAGVAALLLRSVAHRARSNRGRPHRRTPRPAGYDGADPDPPHPPRRALVARPRDLRPTRFIGDAAKDRPRSAYLPFGGGRRICIGQSFALMEMVLMVAIMSQRLTFDLCPNHPVELEAMLTLRPKHGLRVIAHRREAL